MTSFVGEALKTGSIEVETIMQVVRELNERRPAGNVEYMKSILDLLEILEQVVPGACTVLGIDLARIAVTETGRLRCIVLNTIDTLKTIARR